MTLFDILDGDKNVLVLSDKANETIYVWDKFNTLYCYEWVIIPIYGNIDSYGWKIVAKKNISSTSENDDKRFHNARMQAITWKTMIDV